MAGRNGEGASSSNKRRKKRKRGHPRFGGEPQTTANRLENSYLAQPAHQQGDGTTSLKGKKAANRRGRKRRQAGGTAVNGQPVANGVSVPAGPQQATNPHSEHDGPDVQENQQIADAGIRVPNGRGGSGRSEAARHPRAGTGERNAAPLYAALDLGTNNCRLLIARPEDRGFRVVDAYSRIVRLGEGVGSNRRLSEAAMDRAIDALAQCHRKLADRGVARSRLIATEACRAAENGDAFIERVKSETGLALEVVNRETEARLAVAGCASLVDPDADGVILFDIGGGSSEIVWLDLRNRCGARGYALTRFIRSWISLPVGVVNLAERHGGVHVTPDIFEAMIEDAAEHLAAFNLASNLTEAIASGRVHMLGTSGTVTTLAGVHLGLRRYDRRRVDGTWLEDGDVSRMIDQLRDMPYEARVENPCIGADRADLVLAGCAILEAIRRRWSCSRLRVADRGLREGILTELMAADGVWSHRRNGARHDRGRHRNRS
ncbi:Ppx/GppA phosphatase family protein [Roseibium sp. M-1]